MCFRWDLLCLVLETLLLLFGKRLNHLQSKRHNDLATSMSSSLATLEMTGPSRMNMDQDVVMLALMDDEMDSTMNHALPQFFTEYSSGEDNLDPRWKEKDMDRGSEEEGESSRLEKMSMEVKRMQEGSNICEEGQGVSGRLYLNFSMSMEV